MKNPTQPKLWELSQDIIELEDLIADIQDSEDLSEPEKESRIEYTFQHWLESGEKFEDKALKVAAWIKHKEAVAEARKTEAQRIGNLGKQDQNEAERMRGYLVFEMTKLGKTKVEGTTAKLSIRKKQPRICLNCEPEQLPDEFKKVEVTPRLNEIKKAMKDDPSIDWAFWSDTTEYSLTIR